MKRIGKHMAHYSLRMLTVMQIIAAATTANADTRDSLFNPQEHTLSIGSLGTASESFVGQAIFDTGGTTPRFSLDNGANWVSGAIGVSAYGVTPASDKVEAAVFMFDAVNIGSVTIGVQCTDFDASGVTNKRALVLGSRSDFVFAGMIDLSGGQGGTGAGGEGGPGAEGGKRAAYFHSNPPTNAAGDGGDAVSAIDDGNGYGGGAGNDFAGGGSYGGSGGVGRDGAAAKGAAGPVYGYAGLNELYGGSGGGGAYYNGSNHKSGGGGGGALEFVATRDLIVTGSIKANGGNGAGGTTSVCGGGGSGGGVILVANKLEFSGSISADGGTGGTRTTNRGGGGGGGGRVAWYCDYAITGAVVNVSVAGGHGGGSDNSSPGSNGVFTVSIGGYPFPRSGTVITIR